MSKAEQNAQFASVLREAAEEIGWLRHAFPVPSHFSCNAVLRAAADHGLDVDECVTAYSRVYFSRRRLRIEDFSSLGIRSAEANNHRETALALAAAVYEAGGL